MKRVGIVGNGPRALLPNLQDYKHIDLWIGADRGAYYLAEQGIKMETALGDFDSVSKEEWMSIHQQARFIDQHPVMKDKTDLEIAVDMALEKAAEEIYFFGVTGGRMDHALMNIQLLYPLLQKEKRAVIVDKGNTIEMFKPGTYSVNAEEHAYISFLAFSNEVAGLTLNGFVYPLENEMVHWGSSLCISNKLSQKKGTFSFRKGILILVKSCDTI